MVTDEMWWLAFDMLPDEIAEKEKPRGFLCVGCIEKRFVILSDNPEFKLHPAHFTFAPLNHITEQPMEHIEWLRSIGYPFKKSERLLNRLTRA